MEFIMGIQVVELTPKELELYKRIHFPNKENFSTNRDIEFSPDASISLTLSLFDRKAIPEIRISYFTDPELNSTLKKSHKEIFEFNGTKGKDIMKHPHFLPYLHYFIFGPDLPAPVREKFFNEVKSEPFPTSGDIPVYINLARSLTRQYNLDPHEVCEEFYKLALECGISNNFAKMIRVAVRKVKVRK
jgi:hypothetical protein